jgi:Transcriptional regulator PadR-like family
MTEKLQDIIAYFESQRIHQLTTEEAVAYIVSCLDEGDKYGLELIKILNLTESIRMSTPILYKAIKFLKAQGVMTSYKVLQGGRGAPRKNFKLVKSKVTGPTIRRLKHFWTNKYPNVNLTLNNIEQ